MLNPKKITAKEIMNDDVLSLHEETPVQEAIVTLEEYQITGAPVVNAAGECVGVFSTTDVLKRDAEIQQGEVPRSGDYFSSDPLSDDFEDYFSKEEYDEEVLGRETVGQWMTTDILSVSPEMTLEEICKRMLNERVHRVLVMEGKTLRGIISSFDIVRLVAGLKPDARRTG